MASDGDTLTSTHNGRGEKVRLQGIDAPEKGLPSPTALNSLSQTFALLKKSKWRPKAKIDINPRSLKGYRMAVFSIVKWSRQVSLLVVQTLCIEGCHIGRARISG